MHRALIILHHLERPDSSPSLRSLLQPMPKLHVPRPLCRDYARSRASGEHRKHHYCLGGRPAAAPPHLLQRRRGPHWQCECSIPSYVAGTPGSECGHLASHQSTTLPREQLLGIALHRTLLPTLFKHCSSGLHGLPSLPRHCLLTPEHSDCLTAHAQVSIRLVYLGYDANETAWHEPVYFIQNLANTSYYRTLTK